MTPLDVLAIGEPMVEFVRASHPEVGEHYLPGFGGDTSNAAIAAARQGARAGYFTALGTDRFGDDLMALWAREGVEAGQVLRRDDAQTGIYFIDPHESGRFFTYYRAGSAASRLAPGDLPRGLIESAAVLHVSAISQAISASARDTVSEAMRIARAAGRSVSYDTNLRLKLWGLEEARRTIHEAVALADIVLPSLDDSATLTGLHDADAVADFYLGLGPSIVAVKMGAEGALVATPERRERIAPVAVDAVDSTGAGDAFGGGFLAWLKHTGDPFAAGRAAALVAALTVTGLGAIAPIPTRDRVVELMAGEGPVPGLGKSR